MRFGRRNKTWAAVGRRLFGDGNPSREEEVPPEETEETAAQAPMEDEEMAAPVEEPPSGPPVSDPRQAIPSAINRFRRVLERAEPAPEDAHWPDECLHELVSALEMVNMVNSPDLRQAIIDTARVLSSYKTAGRARECLPFLMESHNILSLMAGDLIVGNDGPMVGYTWRGMYRDMLVRMKEEGVALIDDNGRARVPEPGPPQAPPVFTAAAPEPAPEPEPAQEPPTVAAAAALLPPETPLEAGGDTMLHMIDEEPPAREESAVVAGNAAPAGDPFGDSLPAPEEPLFAASGPALADGLDLGAEALAREESAEEPAEESAQFPAVAEEAESSPDAAEESSAEDAAAGDGMNPGEETPADGAPEEAEVAEAAAEIVEPGQESVQEETAAEMEEEDAGEPAEEAEAPQTLETVQGELQQAIMTGNVRAAKDLAIRLAGMLARREVDNANDALAAARERLAKNGAAIGEGCQRVADAEARVRHAEEEITARQEEHAACRERISGLDGDIHRRRGELEELERQIEELQQARSAALAELHGLESERAAALTGESLIQTEITSLEEEEEAGREFLEEARGRLAAMRAEKERIEGEMIRIQQELERRQRAVVEIERPLAEEAEPARGGQEMLF